MPFQKVCVSQDESLIFLSSKYEIEAFKLNYVLYKGVQFEKEIRNFKVFQVDNLNIFCIQF